MTSQILLIDDSEITLQMEKAVLEQRGYEVQATTTLVEFERLCRNTAIRAASQLGGGLLFLNASPSAVETPKIVTRTQPPTTACGANDGCQDRDERRRPNRTLRFCVLRLLFWKNGNFLPRIPRIFTK